MKRVYVRCQSCGILTPVNLDPKWFPEFEVFRCPDVEGGCVQYIAVESQLQLRVEVLRILRLEPGREPDEEVGG